MRLGSAGIAALLGALALALAAGAPPGAHAVEPPLELKWDQLIPPAPPKPPKPFFAGRSAADPANPHDGPAAGHQTPEARWMSRPAPPADAPSAPPAVVESLDGKRVRIGGYIVPLDFESTRVKEFLLVQIYGACIHVPPPPANQIIYIKADQAFEMKTSAFDPVWVTGTLKVATAHTGLADAGYTLSAEKVEPRQDHR